MVKLSNKTLHKLLPSLEEFNNALQNIIEDFPIIQYGIFDSFLVGSDLENYPSIYIVLEANKFNEMEFYKVLNEFRKGECLIAEYTFKTLGYKQYQYILAIAIPEEYLDTYKKFVSNLTKEDLKNEVIRYDEQEWIIPKY